MLSLRRPTGSSLHSLFDKAEGDGLFPVKPEELRRSGLDYLFPVNLAVKHPVDYFTVGDIDFTVVVVDVDCRDAVAVFVAESG